MSYRIPAHVIATVAEVIVDSETHASMDNLFLYANAPGDPPDGNKLTKAQAWLRRVNQDPGIDGLEVLGRLVEGYMEPPNSPSWRPGDTDHLDDYQRLRMEKLNAAFRRAALRYVAGGTVTRATGSPTRSLAEVIKKLNYEAIDEEFDRAVRNAESNPREAVSAACNILESVFKTYIEEEGLAAPKKKDLQGLWKVVREDMNFNPSRIEDRDLQEILSGLFASVNGIGALRTHASSAHGAGKQAYRLQPRHARLAVHAAHTLANFVLETWQERKRGGA